LSPLQDKEAQELGTHLLVLLVAHIRIVCQAKRHHGPRRVCNALLVLTQDDSTSKSMAVATFTSVVLPLKRYYRMTNQLLRAVPKLPVPGTKEERQARRNQQFTVPQLG
jgi:hypothetical protein